MVRFFPNIYPDEIFYSIVARYHKRSGNIDFSYTSLELFGRSYKVSTIDMPNDLEFFVNQLPKNLGYTSDTIIQNHTLFNCYAPFIPENNKLEIIKTMKYGNGARINSLSGRSAKNKLNREYLYYCPLCSQEDYKRYGESYFHRLHQIPGVSVCTDHKCILNPYTEHINTTDKRVHHCCDYNLLDLNVYYESDKKYEKELVDISNSFKYILEGNLNQYNQYEIYKIYKYFMNRNNLIRTNKYVNQEKLYEKFTNHYSNRLLYKVNCNIKDKNSDNWLAKISKKPTFILEPVRNILFIHFLAGNMKSFLDEYTAECTQKPSIDKFNEYDKLLDEDKSKILEYISKKSSCTRTELYKNLTSEFNRCKERDKDWFEQNMPEPIRKINPKCHQEEKEGYRVDIEKYINENPTYNRTQIKASLRKQYNWIFNNDREWLNNILLSKNSKKSDIRIKYEQRILDYMRDNSVKYRIEVKRALSKEYDWLFRNDRDWFEQNMPKSVDYGQRNINKKSNVDWNKRDEVILEEVKKLYEEIIKNNTNRKITKTYLVNMLKPQYKTSVRSYLDNMPTTKEYINSIVETTEQYQMRKVDIAVEKLNNEGIELKNWKIKKTAGIDYCTYSQVNERINELISI